MSHKLSILEEKIKQIPHIFQNIEKVINKQLEIKIEIKLNIQPEIINPAYKDGRRWQQLRKF